ncbi:hypothetical protein NITUZ_60033 [Candidatus Nitrosotenuis uzonensis]|uniref:Antitoxin n=2 Tax=Candidatus Nitrosotenuis uzonensis TaxID=1407055 RepID=V6AUF2_9ARCH|nr:hypothetical protein NITUZ_60033 [Candidatus Nitrosotenuis uzonensis]
MLYMHYITMGTTTISLSDEAYKILKAQKMEGESFSDLILRKFGKGDLFPHSDQFLASFL